MNFLNGSGINSNEIPGRCPAYLDRHAQIEKELELPEIETKKHDLTVVSKKTQERLKALGIGDRLIG
jgi:hypothetical protein